MTEPTLLEFPTEFPIKVLGREHPDFRNAVIGLIADHADFDHDNHVKENASRDGNFVSLTISFNATSQEQVDAIYQALHDHELVLMIF